MTQTDCTSFPLDINIDSFTNAVYLAALLASLPENRTAFRKSDLYKIRVTPTDEATNHLINKLLNNNIIHTNKSSYKINFENNKYSLKELLENITLIAEENLDIGNSLGEAILIFECMEFIKVSLKIKEEIQLSVDDLKKIKEIIRFYPLSVLLMFIWRGLQSFDRSDARLALASNHYSSPIELIISKAHYYFIQHKLYGKEPKKFIRPSNYKESVLTKLFFRYALDIQDYFNEYIV